MAIRVMTKVWDEGPEDRTETIVLLCLADHANDEGHCYPSISRIADRCRLSRQGTLNVLERLEQNGWITKYPGGGRGNPNQYQIHLDRFSKGSSPLDGKTTEKGKADKQKGKADKAKGSSSLDGNRQGTVKEPSESSAPAREDEAVQVYHDVMPRRANNIQKGKIAQTVTDIDRWRDVVEEWRLSDYNPGNVKGMLQVYRDGWDDDRGSSGTSSGKVPDEPESDAQEAHERGHYWDEDGFLRTKEGAKLYKRGYPIRK